MTQRELVSIIKTTVLETAIAVNEAYRNHGTLVCRADIIRDIGKALYDNGVTQGKLSPFSKTNGVKGKLWVQTQEYLRYKNEMFN
jgi:hypothetical protein